MTTAKTAPAPRPGPRGFTGFIGWTFFDPANLVSVALLLAAAAFVLYGEHLRDTGDGYMAIALYACLAAFLRGYMFKYYHGRLFGRLVVFAVLVGGLLASGLLWEDRSGAYRALRGTGAIAEIPALPHFHIAALLHLVVAVTLTIHIVLPRRWLVRATDDLADRAGQDDAPDAPRESVDDPKPKA